MAIVFFGRGGFSPNPSGGCGVMHTGKSHYSPPDRKPSHAKPKTDVAPEITDTEPKEFGLEGVAGPERPEKIES